MFLILIKNRHLLLILIRDRFLLLILIKNPPLLLILILLIKSQNPILSGGSVLHGACRRAILAILIVVQESAGAILIPDHA